MSQQDYIMHCYKCDYNAELKMYPHRSAKTGHMVGWIFVCMEHDETELPETLELA